MQIRTIFIIQFFLFGATSANTGSGQYTSDLQKMGGLGISVKECTAIESKLGQLLYANVDNFGSSTKDALDPAYVKMVKDLQLGGVLPKTRVTKYSKIVEVHKKLQEVSELPLLIGVDKMILEEATFGLGFGSGMLNNRASKVSGECFEREVFLNAFFHRVSGVNHALGPTIEKTDGSDFLARDIAEVAPKARALINTFSGAGLAATNKHFPYTPATYDLHDKTADDKLPKSTVHTKLEPFRELASEAGFVMTTHVLNSNIDKDNIVTFSNEWIRILREEIGFQGLIITDGIFMFNRYSESIRRMSSPWPQDQVPLSSENSIFAARSILAGHDMVIVESISADTYKIFRDLLRLACQNKPISKKFRDRVKESYRRIVEYKKMHEKALRFNKDIPKNLYEEASEIYADSYYRKPEALCIHPKFPAWRKKAEVYLVNSPSQTSSSLNERSEPASR